MLETTSEHSAVCHINDFKQQMRGSNCLGVTIHFEVAITGGLAGRQGEER